MAERSMQAIGEIMADRKVAYHRWTNAKNWLTYRDVEADLCGGENQGDIDFDGVIYVDVKDFFDAVDSHFDDEEPVSEAVERAWSEWIEAGAPVE